MFISNSASNLIVGCKYKKSEWSDCDPVTKTKTRVMPLKRDVDGCSKEKTETKPCRIKNKDGKKENGKTIFLCFKAENK